MVSIFLIQPALFIPKSIVRLPVLPHLIAIVVGVIGGCSMASKNAEPFNCPTCNGAYKLVRAEADSRSFNGPIECYYCGGPLVGREGEFVLKYFVADKPRKRAKPSRVK